MNKTRLGLIATLTFVLLGLNTALAIPQATTYRVATTGSDNNSCGTTAAPCRTIQHAASLAESGDTILVAAGTYADSQNCIVGVQTAFVCIRNKHLTILGGYTTNNWTTADPTINITILDGQNSHRLFYISSSTTDNGSIHMEGFTIQNGLNKGANSGEDFLTSAFGGGILVDHAQVIMRHMIFKNNRAIGGNTNKDYGGAAGGGGLAIRATNPAILENILFENNEARGGTGVERGGFGIGGGLYTFQTDMNGGYMTFRNNLSIGGSSNGSGISSGYYADAQGAGVAFQNGSIVNVHHLEVYDNQATGGNAPNGEAGGAFGGGIFAEVAELILTDVNVYDNLALGGNGRNETNKASLGFGGGIATGTADITLERLRVVNNIARGGNGQTWAGSGGGGGYYLSGFTEVTIANSIFANNLVEVGSGISPGGGGGGIFANFANINVTHSTFADNQLGDSTLQGIGLVVINGGSINLNYSIIANHTQSSSAYAIHAQPSGTVNLNKNLFYGNNFDTGGGGTFNGMGTNLSGNPNFLSPGSPNYDYHITSGSAAIDQATGSTTPVDFDNESRTTSAPADVGADEFVPLFLSAIPGNGALMLNWTAVPGLLTNLDHYQVLVTPSAGANPPAQGTSFAVGLNTSATLTGLTNFANYTIHIEARNGDNNTIGKSNTITLYPTDIQLFLPFVKR
ncbi:MAG: fibronectin type III domain-containing protein [Ardenticatenaceae bacterium]|nr:fibronectin type III domain-containing protein [Ardenticatenaceae bacterium]